MELSPQQKRALLAPVRCFLLDMDGTFYLGNQLLEGSLDFLSALDATGRTACFLTNNSSKSARVYDEKLARMGVPERYRRVITSGHAAAHYCLKTFPGKSAWVLGNDMLKEELCAMGLRISEEAPDYVLIAYDTTLTKMYNEANCEALGITDYVLKTNVPEGQECYDAAADLADDG